MSLWLLDTTTFIAAMNGEGGIRERVNAIGLAVKRGQTQPLVTSAIVVSELLFGAEASANPERNREQAYRAVARFSILPFDMDAGRHFAELRAHFRRIGKPRPRIDLMIAAQARSIGATLVTHDEDLKGVQIPGVTVEDWHAPAR